MSSSVNLSLTPSEVVFFNGQEFAKQVLIGNVTLMHVDAKVSAAELGLAMLRAAFLGAERSGALRLEVRQKKALLGLARRDTLYAEPLGGAPAWPEPSFESKLVQLAAQWKAANGSNEVSNIIVALLGQDSANPWQSLAEIIKSQLAQRGLLRAIQERKLKIFVSTRYELPESTAAMLLRQPVAPVQDLLADCQHNRPQVWKLLEAHIRRAIQQRTEQSDSSDD